MSGRWKISRFRRSVRGRRAARPRPASGGPVVCAVHAGEAAAAPHVAGPAVTNALATLLSRHVLRDGEIILLALKPSVWSIFFSCLPVLAAALITIATTRLFAAHHLHIAVEAALMMVACRAALAVMSWSGRLYLLTDRRVVRIAGTFTSCIDDIPLRRVARTRLTSAAYERLWRLGSVEIIPESDEWPCSVWQTIPRPREVHEVIVRAVNRSKQAGYCGRLW